MGAAEGGSAPARPAPGQLLSSFHVPATTSRQFSCQTGWLRGKILPGELGLALTSEGTRARAVLRDAASRAGALPAYRTHCRRAPSTDPLLGVLKKYQMLNFQRITGPKHQSSPGREARVKGF